MAETQTQTQAQAQAQVKRKAFVLLSGGVDSTTLLHKAIIDFSPNNEDDTLARILYNQGERREYQNGGQGLVDPIPWVEALSIDYGQRHKKELGYAYRTCASLGITHTTLNIGQLLGQSALTDATREIPSIDYADIKGVSPSYVPFRNGTLLAVATARAVNWVNSTYSESLSSPPRNVAGVYIAAHADDAAGDAYPDCTVEFMGAMANAIHVGTYYSVRLHTPLIALEKSKIVEMGASLGVEFENTWSCYLGGDKHCGVCPTCRARRSSFVAAEVYDPTEYAQHVNT